MGWGGGGTRPSPLCSTQWDVYGLLQALAVTRPAQVIGGGHTCLCVRTRRRCEEGTPAGPAAEGTNVEWQSVQQLRMVGLRNQSHHGNTEGERVKPDQTTRDSAYWLGRIMRALIVGFGSGNRLDQMGKVRCSAGPPQLQPQAG